MLKNPPSAENKIINEERAFTARRNNNKDEEPAFGRAEEKLKIAPFGARKMNMVEESAFGGKKKIKMNFNETINNNENV